MSDSPLVPNVGRRGDPKDVQLQERYNQLHQWAARKGFAIMQAVAPVAGFRRMRWAFPDGSQVECIENVNGVRPIRIANVYVPPLGGDARLPPLFYGVMFDTTFYDGGLYEFTFTATFGEGEEETSYAYTGINAQFLWPTQKALPLPDGVLWEDLTSEERTEALVLHTKEGWLSKFLYSGCLVGDPELGDCPLGVGVVANNAAALRSRGIPTYEAEIESIERNISTPYRLASNGSFIEQGPNYHAHRPQFLHRSTGLYVDLVHAPSAAYEFITLGLVPVALSPAPGLRGHPAIYGGTLYFFTHPAEGSYTREERFFRVYRKPLAARFPEALTAWPDDYSLGWDLVMEWNHYDIDPDYDDFYFTDCWTQWHPTEPRLITQVWGVGEVAGLRPGAVLNEKVHLTTAAGVGEYPYTYTDPASLIDRVTDKVLEFAPDDEGAWRADVTEFEYEPPYYDVSRAETDPFYEEIYTFSAVKSTSEWNYVTDGSGNGGYLNRSFTVDMDSSHSVEIPTLDIDFESVAGRVSKAGYTEDPDNPGQYVRYVIGIKARRQIQQSAFSISEDKPGRSWTQQQERPTPTSAWSILSNTFNSFDVAPYAVARDTLDRISYRLFPMEGPPFPVRTAAELCLPEGEVDEREAYVFYEEIEASTASPTTRYSEKGKHTFQGDPYGVLFVTRSKHRIDEAPGSMPYATMGVTKPEWAADSLFYGQSIGFQIHLAGITVVKPYPLPADNTIKGHIFGGVLEASFDRDRTTRTGLLWLNPGVSLKLGPSVSRIYGGLETLLNTPDRYETYVRDTTTIRTLSDWWESNTPLDPFSLDVPIDASELKLHYHKGGAGSTLTKDIYSLELYQTENHHLERRSYGVRRYHIDRNANYPWNGNYQFHWRDENFEVSGIHGVRHDARTGVWYGVFQNLPSSLMWDYAGLYIPEPESAGTIPFIYTPVAGEEGLYTPDTIYFMAELRYSRASPYPFSAILV